MSLIKGYGIFEQCNGTVLYGLKIFSIWSLSIKVNKAKHTKHIKVLKVVEKKCMDII